MIAMKTMALGFLLASFMALVSCTGRSEDQAALERRLTQAEDHIAIERLLMRYAGAFNTGNADAYVGTFAPDGVLDIRRNADEEPFAGPWEGREAIRRQWFSDVAPDNDIRKFGPMRHVTTNYEIDVEGDHARVRAFFMELISNGANTPSGSNPPTIYQAGRYEDELVKLDGEWFFKKRSVITDLNDKFVPD
jgi:hypothetical protein